MAPIKSEPVSPKKIREFFNAHPSTEDMDDHISDCSHSTKVTVLLHRSTNIVLDQITSKDGKHTVYSVCAKCHKNPEEWIGVPVKQGHNSSSVILNPSIKEHFNLMVQSPNAKYHQLDDGYILTHTEALPSTAGLNLIRPNTPIGITIRKQKTTCKPRKLMCDWLCEYLKQPNAPFAVLEKEELAILKAKYASENCKKQKKCNKQL